MPTILLLSGPNLNLFGEREPDVYGSDTLDEMVSDARRRPRRTATTSSTSSRTTKARWSKPCTAPGNGSPRSWSTPARSTHYGLSLADALRAFDGVKIELHVSNPAAREDFRQISVLAPAVTGVVAGFGRAGYRLAVDAAVAVLASG